MMNQKRRERLERQEREFTEYRSGIAAGLNERLRQAGALDCRTDGCENAAGVSGLCASCFMRVNARSIL